MKTLKILSVVVMISVALCGCSKKDNIAKVDVNRVVIESAAVKTLRAEHNATITELQAWREQAIADVEKQSNKTEKDALINKYSAEFAEKQRALETEYATKLQEVDKKISEIIEQEAKKQGYSVVLAKSVVLVGGVDITDDIIELVK